MTRIADDRGRRVAARPGALCVAAFVAACLCLSDRVLGATDTSPKAAAPGRAGMVVGIDPASGEPGPLTAEQARAMRAGADPALDRSTAGLTMITLADGSRRVNLQGRFRAYSVLTVDASGTARVECVDGLAAALALIHAGAPPAAPAVATARRLVGPPEE